MLNLTRTIGQSILIYPGDVPADMTVAEWVKAEWFNQSGHQVALGIYAPSGLKVLRDELVDKEK